MDISLSKIADSDNTITVILLIVIIVSFMVSYFIYVFYKNEILGAQPQEGLPLSIFPSRNSAYRRLPNYGTSSENGIETSLVISSSLPISDPNRNNNTRVRDNAATTGSASSNVELRRVGNKILYSYKDPPTSSNLSNRGHNRINLKRMREPNNAVTRKLIKSSSLPARGSRKRFPKISRGAYMRKVLKQRYGCCVPSPPIPPRPPMFHFRRIPPINNVMPVSTNNSQRSDLMDIEMQELVRPVTINPNNPETHIMDVIRKYFSDPNLLKIDFDSM